MPSQRITAVSDAAAGTGPPIRAGVRLRQAGSAAAAAPASIKAQAIPPNIRFMPSLPFLSALALRCLSAVGPI